MIEVQSRTSCEDLIKEKDKEIERLNKAREDDIKYNKYLQKELAKSNNIIKEVREYIEENTRTGGINKDKRYFKSPSQSIDILEILDKEKDNEQR